MDEIFIKKDYLEEWVAKYFDKDLISIYDILDKIDELAYEIERLKEKLEEGE